MRRAAALAAADPLPESGAAQAVAGCFHCGEPLVPGARFEALVDGKPRATCCAGCAAVAQAIADGGLADYYRRRERLPESPGDPPASADLSVFDRDEVQRGFVTSPAAYEREAALILEGLRCPACLWLNEAHLAKQPGVLSAQVNYTTRRAKVRWDARVTRLSDILLAIEAIGYRAFPYDPGAMERSRERERRDALRRLAVAALGMMQVMMYAYPAYIAGAGEMPFEAGQLMRWASLVLTLPVVAYASLPFFRGALRDLRQRRAGMDVPVALGIGAGFAASVWATLSGTGEVYYDSVTMFVFLLLGGRYLELRARHRAAAYLEYLARALPATAQRLEPGSAPRRTQAVPAGALVAGDRVSVRAGEAFPADGTIEEGSTEVDEALVTGESRPVGRAPRDTVIGGSVNRGHPVVVRVDRVGADTLLSGIVRLMERAVAERPRLQVLADRVAARFVVVVLGLAAAAALAWAWADPAQALPVAVAMLVVSCPCALSLATPMALAVANATMARLGVVVTRARAIESLARSTHVVFDKTGTLTEGALKVTEVRLHAPVTRERVLGLAAALGHNSTHPVARAIAAEATWVPPQVDELREYPGEGMEGRIAGRRYRMGQRRFVAALCPGVRGPVALPTEATAVWVGDEQALLAQVILQDRLRGDVRELVEGLSRSGRMVLLLSGDGAEAVKGAARQAGIADWQARMLPADKREAVRVLQQQGATVAMIGDGVNDAPVLAQADVAIAMGQGAALAQGAADMVMVSPRIRDLDKAFRLSRKTLGIVRQNLYWSAAYNIVALPLAAAGLVTPWMAGIGMSASSLLVVLNALRARRAD